jgi:acyl-CoA thioester hydrolase
VANQFRLVLAFEGIRKELSILDPDSASQWSEAVETGRRVVYPWLCDQMGHLATQYYMAFFDDAFYHLLATIGPIHTHTDAGSFGWADVRHEIDYLGELRSGDLVTLRSWVAEIGTKSLTHVTYMTHTESGKPCARALSKTVRFDLTRRVAIDIEPSLRQAIADKGILRRES